MQNDNRNIMIMAVSLIIAGLFSLYIYSKDLKQVDTVYVKNFPRTVGSWVSEETPLSKGDLLILGTNNAFFRKYKDPDGEAVYLYIVYSQNNDKITHLPEVCYRGKGVSFLEETRDIIPVDYQHLNIDTNRLLLQSGKLYQISFYWFKAGDHFTSSYWKEKIFITLNTLLGQSKGNALIRISADVINKDEKTAIKEVKEFTNLITPQLFKYLP